ncbi:hypothetical protein CEUSTIGMA_g7172.t1 [Chlamydomonas eustigma]|uniref:Apyrase n=1 Tax=Chlamydomonas eustigma TaxID=1157962 RepID=A0A250X9H6_9CHLO|nr:hypothetical protein CEUSTIGMA_g7172.t1 [Chlamydomonas eustigma]|eukprot:GAX79731.1 hypothetical protein CEUSTIGMA_g7172.t1 [Chlamydomonas eustigma]
MQRSRSNTNVQTVMGTNGGYVSSLNDANSALSSELSSVSSYTKSTSGSSASKELNLRKLARGYALRLMLALKFGRPLPLLLTLFTTVMLTSGCWYTLTDRNTASTVSAKYQVRYAVYFDGGSSGTRVHVFRYHLVPWPQYVEVELPDQSSHVEPGLSHYADAPAEAATSLIPLLQFAYQQVPEQYRASTPVRLLATAGLRLVTDEQRQAILGACRSMLGSSDFKFRHDWVKVIGGEMEGVYAWTGANYAAGALQDTINQHIHQARRSLESTAPGSFHGIMELGGASFQITFLTASDGLEALEGAKSNVVPVKLPGLKAELFTHSYLGLGMDAALHKAAAYVLDDSSAGSGKDIMDPCLPVGYLASDGRRGASSFGECLKVAINVIPLSGCLAALSKKGFEAKSKVQSFKEHALSENEGEGEEAHSRRRSLVAEDDAAGVNIVSRNSMNGRCQVDGVEVPAVTGTFLAVENLFWTAKALGLHSEATLQELHDAGQRHCSHHWSSLHAQFSGHVPDQFLTRYCFGAAYVFALLHIGLGFGLEDRILRFTNTLKVQRKGAAGSKGHDQAEDQVGRKISLDSMEVPLNWINGAMIMDAMGEERENVRGVFGGFGSEDFLTFSGAQHMLLLPGCLILLAAAIVGTFYYMRLRRRGRLRSPTEQSVNAPRLSHVDLRNGKEGSACGYHQEQQENADALLSLSSRSLSLSRFSQGVNGLAGKKPQSFQIINVQDS